MKLMKPIKRSILLITTMFLDQRERISKLHRDCKGSTKPTRQLIIYIAIKKQKKQKKKKKQQNKKKNFF